MPHTESRRELRAALVGTGAMGREHLKCLRAQPGVRTVAICDRQPSLAEIAADEFGVPRWFTDVDEMLAAERPDVVHIAAPAAAHHDLAGRAMRAGAHVFVEKPITSEEWQFLELREIAETHGRWLLEDQNYLFNESCQALLALVRSGEAGDVCHLEIAFCAEVLGPGSAFADLNVPHPSAREQGGIVSDFLPHLAYLAVAFIGPHRGVHVSWRQRVKGGAGPDECAALVEGERGTASLYFSAAAQPNSFTIRARGSRLTAEADLFEPRIVVAPRRPGPAALLPSRNNLAMSRAHAGAALRSLTRRFAGRPIALEGMWELIGRTYRALAAGGDPPIAIADIEASTRLVADLAGTCDGTPA